MKKCSNCYYKYYSSKYQRCMSCVASSTTRGKMFPLWTQEENKTNADKIRSMTDDELSIRLAKSGCPPCYFSKDGDIECPPGKEPSLADCPKCWLEWLRQEVKE